MAILPKTDVPASVASSALTTEAPEPINNREPESARPDLSSFSKDDLRSMLNTGEREVPTIPAEKEPPEIKQPDTLKQQEEEKKNLNIPDKFKNPDGSLNQDNLLKSYTEAEQMMMRQNQTLKDVELLKTENQELRQYLEEMKSFKDNLEQRIAEAESSQTLSPEEYAQLSPQEQQAYIDKRVESKVKQLEIQQEAKRDMDMKIANSIAEVSKMAGYEQLKDNINSLLKSNIVDYHPDAPKIAYWASLGQKAEQIATEARNMGFSEGYEKAKQEMGKRVDSGKSMTPAEVNSLSSDDLRKMSKDDLAKMLPRFHTDVYTLDTGN